MNYNDKITNIANQMSESNDDHYSSDFLRASIKNLKISVMITTNYLMSEEIIFGRIRIRN